MSPRHPRAPCCDWWHFNDICINLSNVLGMKNTTLTLCIALATAICGCASPTVWVKSDAGDDEWRIDTATCDAAAAVKLEEWQEDLKKRTGGRAGSTSICYSNGPSGPNQCVTTSTGSLSPAETNQFLNKNLDSCLVQKGWERVRLDEASRRNLTARKY